MNVSSVGYARKEKHVFHRAREQKKVMAWKRKLGETKEDTNIKKTWTLINKCRCVLGPCTSGRLEYLRLPRTLWYRVELGRMRPWNKPQPGLPNSSWGLESHSLAWNPSCHPPDKSWLESESPVGGGWGGGVPISVSIKGHFGVLGRTVMWGREGGLWRKVLGSPALWQPLPSSGILSRSFAPPSLSFFISKMCWYRTCLTVSSQIERCDP